jgi:hypothetical protein
MMDKLCEICGERLYSYNSHIITYDESEVEVCQTCKQRFDDLLDSENKNYEGSKKYFAALENGRLYSCIVVNGNKIHYIKNRDNFDARDIRLITENTLKLVNANNTLSQKNNDTIYLLEKINDNLANIKKTLSFFYYLVLASLLLSGMFLLLRFIFSIPGNL